jgi:urease accessory protein
MSDTVGLLALVQIADSFFPSGTFAHSLGLEQLARERTIATPEDVASFTSSVLEYSISTADAVAAARSVRAANDDDLPALNEVDRELFAMKAPSELRRAATDTGRRLLEEVATHHKDEMLGRFLDEVRSGRTPGTHPVAFGVVAATFGASPETVAALVMQGTVNAILQASLRLLPVSHRDVQSVLHRLRPRVAELAERAAQPGRLLQSFHPVQDIASMRHEVASARLFAS